MPWEFLIKFAGGSLITVVGIVIVGFFAKTIIKQTVESTVKRFESAIVRAEEAHKKDFDLRERGIKVYEALWEKTALFPIWPRAEGITYDQLLTFSQELKDLYFEGGGIYLSVEVQKSYDHLQETISEILKAKQNGVIPDEEYDQIRDQCSSLRTEMTNDLLSRRAVSF